MPVPLVEYEYPVFEYITLLTNFKFNTPVVYCVVVTMALVLEEKYIKLETNVVPKGVILEGTRYEFVFTIKSTALVIFAIII